MNLYVALSQSITCCCPCLSVVDWLPESINIFPPFSVCSLQIGHAEVVAVVSMVVALLPAVVLVVAMVAVLSGAVVETTCIGKRLLLILHYAVFSL